MIFRQLFEPLSSTYTYLIGCQETGQAVLVDPVYPTWERDADLLRSLGLQLMATVETHVHADHITSALKLKSELGSQIIYPILSQCKGADAVAMENEVLHVGSVRLMPIATPGHTDDHLAYQVDDRLLTGDALLIDGCGRTDFQNGDMKVLYRSVMEKLYQLPEDTLVYPGHDYQQRCVSTIRQEKQRNARLPVDQTLEGFIEIMSQLNLPYPRFIDHAVPGNQACGVCPADLPEELQSYCAQMTQSVQG